MPRFTRFVAITSVLLFILYIVYRRPHEFTKIPASTPPVIPANSKIKPADSGQQDTHTPPVSAAPKASQVPRTLRELLASEFPYDPSTVFPGFIWQTWKSTPSEADFEFRGPEATWTERHPGFIHEVIRDDVAALLIKHLYANVPDVLEAYEALPKPILKADFFRYLILLARGGVYSDIDTQVIKPAWEWVPQELVLEKYGLVIGIEADPDREDWAQWYSRRVQFCQWTMRSKPGHPALIEAVSRLTEKTLAKKKAHTLLKDSDESVVEWTGPAIWTDAIFAYLNSQIPSDPTQKPLEASGYSWKDLTGLTDARRIGDVIILPITGFSPGQGHMGSLEFDDPHAMVKHDFEGTWKPESDRIKPET